MWWQPVAESDLFKDRSTEPLQAEFSPMQFIPVLEKKNLENQGGNAGIRLLAHKVHT